MKIDHLLLLRHSLLTLAFALFSTQAAQAHLMVAQHGTLNFVDNGAFMVLSVPVTALQGVDDDGDGKLSTAELATHRMGIISTIERDVQLVGGQGKRPLEGLMLMPSPPDDSPESPAPQLVVMGRFALADGNDPLSFSVKLFGHAPQEQTFKITATRQASADKQLMVLSTGQSMRAVFPPWWSVLKDYVTLGAEHIFTGLDHLLFLVVVLAVGWGWRLIVLALTIFTLGHATTLMLSLLWGVSLSSAVVEPAIAATIAGIALVDLYLSRTGRKLAPQWRFMMIFGCALVHGLGLASALTDWGLDGQHRLLSLFGFNLGIELAQIACALSVILIVIALRRFSSDLVVQKFSTVMMMCAVAAGTFWFFERIMV